MNFGSIALLVSLLGIVFIGVALLAEYLGWTNLFHTIVNIFNGIANVFSRIFGWAPTPLRILFFLLVAVLTVGFMVNWFIAADKVCAFNGALYEGDALAVMTAKFSDSADRSVYLNNDLVGNFLVLGADVKAKPAVGIENYNDLMIVVPPDFDLEAYPSATGVGGKVAGTQKYKYYFDGGSPSSLCFAGDCTKDLSGKDVIDFNLQVNPVQVNGSQRCNLHWVGGLESRALGYVSYSTKLADDGTTVLLEVSGSGGSVEKLFGLVVGEFNLGMCPQTGVDGEVLLKAWGQNTNGTPEFFEGWVQSKYFSVNDLPNVDVNNVKDVSKIVGIGGRESLIVDANHRWDNSFVEVKQNNSDIITYGCDESNNVTVKLQGIDIFSKELLVVFIVGMGLIMLLKYLQ
jgi:hypothetical protein